MTRRQFGHPGLDQLDELLDADADVSVASLADVRAHVEQCEHCTRELAGLRRVRTMLHAARVELPMPDLLAERIQVAVQREAGHRVTGAVPVHEQLSFDDRPPVFDVPLPWATDPAADDPRAESASGQATSGGTVTQLRPRRRSPLVWLGAAAAAVLAIGVGGGVAMSQFSGGLTASAPDGAAAPAADSAAESAPYYAGSQAAGQSLDRSSGAAAEQSGLVELTPENLPVAARGLTAHSSGDEHSELRSSSPDCATRLGIDPATVAIRALWNGEPALVYVVPAGDNDNITVVDADCQAGQGGGFRYDAVASR